MKDVYQVLREKEQQTEQLRKEVEALRTVAPMLAAQSDTPAAEPILIDPSDAVKLWWK